MIARYQRQTADANRADAAGAVILLQVEQPAPQPQRRHGAFWPRWLSLYWPG
ncbi:MAG: hypothetical protein R2932_00775 [Caldilineaceae bacterium]